MRLAQSFTRWSALLLAVLAVLSGPAPAVAATDTWSSVPIDGGGVPQLGAGGEGDSLVVWATSPAGLYRSSDGGRTWARSQAAPSVRASLAGIDPRDGNRAFVMFLRPEFGGPGANGLFFTTDGGATWRRAGLPRLLFVYQVAFDPSEEDVLFAATSEGLYRSDDGGRSWSLTGSLNEAVYAVTVAPDDPRLLLVSTLDKVYRSTDGGATFTEVFGSGLYFGFVFDPHDPDRVYGSFGALYRSDDRGLSWTRIGYPFGFTQNTLDVDEDGTLYAGSEVGVIRSTNGGATFTPRASQERRSPDDSISSLVALPNGDVLASGSRGVWRQAEGETGWRPSSRGIRALDIAGLAVTAEGRLLVSVPRNGIFRSDDGTRFRSSSQGLRSPLGVPGLKLVPAPSDPDIVYGSDTLEFFRSDDGGVTWRRLTIPNPARLVRILAVDPADPDTVYAGGEEYHPRDDLGKCHALRSRDGGASWTCLEGDDIYQLTAVVIEPAQPRRLYALDGSRLVISDDQGDSWRATGHGLPTDQGLSSTLARDRRGRLYVVNTEGWVFRSVNGGASFAPAGLLPSPFVTELVADPRRPETLYAFIQRLGVFRSRNGGRTWQRLGTGLPAALFTGVAVLDVERGRLWAGTQGRGLYRIDVP